MTDQVIDKVLISLRRIIRATDQYSRTLIKLSGLTAPQVLVLQAIHNHDGISVGDLAESLSLSQATVSNILDRLEKRGLLFREKSTRDKRRTLLRLSETGSNALVDAPTPLQERFVGKFRALEDWEQSQILASLQRVAHMMNADGIDAAPVLDLGSLDRMAPPPDEPGEGV